MAWQPPPPPQEVVQAAQETVEEIIKKGRETAGGAQDAAEETAQEVVIIARAVIIEAVNTTAEAGRHAAHEANRKAKRAQAAARDRVRRVSGGVRARDSDLLHWKVEEKEEEAPGKAHTWLIVKCVVATVVLCVTLTVEVEVSAGAAGAQVAAVTIAVIVLIIVTVLAHTAVTSAATEAVVRAAVGATLEPLRRAARRRPAVLLALQQVERHLLSAMGPARTEAEELIKNRSADEALAHAYDELIRKARELLLIRRAARPRP